MIVAAGKVMSQLMRQQDAKQCHRKRQARQEQPGLHERLEI
jgi:hypothetical protein